MRTNLKKAFKYFKVMIVFTISLHILGFIAGTHASEPADSDCISVLTPKEQRWLAEHSVVRYASIPDWMPLGRFTGAGQYVGIGSDIILNNIFSPIDSFLKSGISIVIKAGAPSVNDLLDSHWGSSNMYQAVYK